MNPDYVSIETPEELAIMGEPQDYELSNQERYLINSGDVLVIHPDEWKRNAAIDVSESMRRNNKGNPSLHWSNPVEWMKVNYPELVLQAELVNLDKFGGEGVEIHFFLRHVQTSTVSEVYPYPIRQVGTGNMAGIPKPNSRQIHDARQVGKKGAIAYLLGYGWSVYARDESIDESADIAAIQSGGGFFGPPPTQTDTSMFASRQPMTQSVPGGSVMSDTYVQPVPMNVAQNMQQYQQAQSNPLADNPQPQAPPAQQATQPAQGYDWSSNNPLA